jgi:hypothetical protein
MPAPTLGPTCQRHDEGERGLRKNGGKSHLFDEGLIEVLRDLRKKGKRD